jgi:RND family efflux transporter MFP subunit
MLVDTALTATRDIPVNLQSTGRLESRATPMVAAETDGRVLTLLADEGDAVTAGQVLASLDPTTADLELRAATAEAARLAALLANEERRSKRLRELHARGSVSREQMDDAEAQRLALAAQHEVAESRVRIARDARRRCELRAPLSGRIEKRLVSPGDYLKRGEPLFAIATTGALRALLPFPEQHAVLLAPGQAVELDSPLLPGKIAKGVLTELRPAVGTANRAVWAIVDIPDTSGWRPEATVRGRVQVALHAGAVVVPAQAVVRRPAGTVAYVIADNRAMQRVLRTGERDGEWVEVLEGLNAGERVATEGAAYLSDGAAIRLAGPAP